MIKDKGGRPRIEFTERDWSNIENLCGLMCTAEEIAGFLGVSADTLDRRIKERCNYGFADYFKRHSSKGRISLRRKQYQVAESGNPTMLIWLGKQYLDQKEKQEIDHQSTDGSMKQPTRIELVAKINDDS